MRKHWKHMEVERKFLVSKRPPGWKAFAHSKVVQGYVPMSSKGVEIRLRQTDSQYALTVKNGHGLTRQEEEVRLPKERFSALWPLTRGRRIYKTRYRIP